MVQTMSIEVPQPTPNPEPEKINGKFAGKDILSMDQFDQPSLEQLFEVTDRINNLNRSQRLAVLQRSAVTLYFSEGSWRTYGSFSSGTARLGGIPLDARQASVDIDDIEFVRDVSTFMDQSDLIVIRHPQTESAKKAWEISMSQRNKKVVPIINAGDGGNGEHPTQALLDLYTIIQHKGRLDHLTGAIARDLLFGRTVKSLIRGLALYPGNTLYLLSPEELRLPRKDFEDFSGRGIKLIEISQAEEIPKDADFWYWTRIQRERFRDQDEYERLKGCFIIDQKFLDRFAGKNTVLMHPGPRNEEISTEIDSDARMIMFQQAKNGLYVRMALLGLVLGKI